MKRIVSSSVETLLVVYETKLQNFTSFTLHRRSSDDDWTLGSLVPMYRRCHQHLERCSSRQSKLGLGRRRPVWLTIEMILATVMSWQLKCDPIQGLIWLLNQSLALERQVPATQGRLKGVDMIYQNRGSYLDLLYGCPNVHSDSCSLSVPAV
ncbi:hypothetical protein CPB83DRAFT_361109 [Crepidotus variabilis]|uniref:Uncharacterized protein n=1 Tax=Crepidotus variabilis TaxID=179855 RepID=A0A9P6JPI0_9AGAR|nr:hypothetical protein CPB83DRAFT_361109 [Crepidotus variabilis]